MHLAGLNGATPSGSRRPDQLGGWQGGRLLIAALALAAGLLMIATAAAAQETRTFTKKASFDDVKFDLTNAITNKGLVIDLTGNLGGMLARTGKDVGSTKPLYKNAEYYTFCSAKLSRDMMEASLANAGLCPFVVFAYETVAKPGEVVVGYRRLPAGTGASAAAFKAINAMLEDVVKEAVK